MTNDTTTGDVVGLIPAAGRAVRLRGVVESSKEVLDLGGEPIIAHLIRRFALAGVKKAFVVIRHGKWDIPAAIADLGFEEVEVAYSVVSDSPSELHSVARGLSLIGDQNVALGYADVVFQPDDAYARLIDHQRDTGADVVVGLFTTPTPERVDMVELDDRMKPSDIVIKQPDRGLAYSWSIALWTPAFSRYLVDYVDELGPSDTSAGVEPSVGMVIRDALRDDFAVEAVILENGEYFDVGTPEDLEEARRRLRPGS